MKDRRIKLLFIGMIAIIAIVFFLFMSYFTASSNGAFREGISGYITNIVYRTIGAIALICVSLALISYFSSKMVTKLKAVIFSFLIILITVGCGVANYYLMSGIFYDIPYLSHPSTTYLRDLDFTYDTSGDYFSIYVSGIDENGNRQSFDIDDSTYEKGQDLLKEDPALFLKVDNLPYTDVIMDHEFLKSVTYEDLNKELLVDDDWRKGEIQIGDKVYKLGDKVSSFLNDGYTFENPEDAAKEIKPYNNIDFYQNDEYSFYLVNNKGQRIDIEANNFTDTTQNIADCVITSISVNPVRYDFEDSSVILSKGIILKWSSYDDAYKAYGKAEEEYEGEVSYRSEDIILHLSFDSDDLLSTIRMIWFNY